MSFGAAIAICAVLSAVLGYLIGSISFSIIFTRIYKKTDVRDHGSGNAGMTNTFRTAGVAPGVLTLIFDFSKGVVATLGGRCLFTYLLPALVGGGYVPIDPIYGELAAGLLCFLGHIYPCYYGFKGGKGVLTAISIIFMLDWRVGCCVLGSFLVVLALTRIVSASSIVGAAVYPLSTCFLYNASAINAEYMAATGTHPFIMTHGHLLLVLYALFFGSMVIVKHIPNIKRLLKGEESRIGSGESKAKSK